METVETKEEKCTGACAEGGKHWKHKIAGSFGLLAITGSLLLLAMFASTLKEYSYIGRDINAQTTITVSGDGDAYATPDIATVSFAISEKAKTPAEARTVVDASMKKISEFLKTAGVEEKDIKTTGYDLYPQYDYVRQPCVAPMNIAAGSVIAPCYGDGKQVLSGYQVTQSVEVKIRKLDDAGKVLGGLADNGATNLSGLNFTVEDPDGVKAQARKIAIDKAQEKAEVLAAELGVKLVRIVSFNEGGVYPVYNYARDMKVEVAAMGGDAAIIPVGENRFTSNVSITYEIR